MWVHSEHSEHSSSCVIRHLLFKLLTLYRIILCLSTFLINSFLSCGRIQYKEQGMESEWRRDWNVSNLIINPPKGGLRPPTGYLTLLSQHSTQRPLPKSVSNCLHEYERRHSPTVQTGDCIPYSSVFASDSVTNAIKRSRRFPVLLIFPSEYFILTGLAHP